MDEMENTGEQVLVIRLEGEIQGNRKQEMDSASSFKDLGHFNFRANEVQSTDSSGLKTQ